MLAKEDKAADETFDLVDIREVPDDQLDELMGGRAQIVPLVKAV